MPAGFRSTDYRHFFVYILSVILNPRMAYNVVALGEGGDWKVLKFKFRIKDN